MWILLSLMKNNLNRCKHGVDYQYDCDLCSAELTHTLVMTDKLEDENWQDVLSENEIMRHELQQIREYCFALGVRNQLDSDNTVFDLVKRLE